MKKNGKKIKENIHNSIINNMGKYSKEEIEYQYKKMLFLLKNNYAENIEIKMHRYSASEIKTYLANTMSITFEVTENCNLNCDYCIYNKYYINQRTTKNKTLDFDIVKNVINFLLPIWNSSLNSSYNNKISIGFYGGEALLNFKLIKKIVSYIKTLKIYEDNRTEFRMTTNGVLLDKYIAFLVENNFNLLISLDGGTKQENSYRKFHDGKIAFDIIYDNVRKIKEKYSDYFDKYVNFISVMHNNNKESDVKDFFANKLNKKVFISSLATDGLNPKWEKEFWLLFKKTSIDEKNETTKPNENTVELYDIITFMRFFSNFVKESYWDLLMSKNENKYFLPTGTCSPFKRMIFVTSDGKILPCERIGHQFEMGTVSADKVNIDFQKIADRYNDAYSNIYERCKKCMFQFGCGQCMFQTNNFDCKLFTANLDENFSNIFAHYFNAMEKDPQLYLKSSNYKMI
ncbi:MAG: radical SAM peptide maturase [Prevotellaceae bacterium]|nr:radical SAM peptide maturase [Prevotellaceae bacterium]